MQHNRYVISHNHRIPQRSFKAGPENHRHPIDRRYM